MSEAVMIEVPTTERMLTCCAGMDANGHPAEAASVSLDERIAPLWFNIHTPPPDEPVLITIAGVPCATPGNMTTLTAQKKSGKTAIMHAVAAASISDCGDTLGVKAFNPDRKTVLHFDTEQSQGKWWSGCNSVLKRAQLTESAIFKSLCLTSLPRLERQEIVWHVIRQEAKTGLFIALIDGQGDMVQNVNDPEETADYVARLHALAIETRCHIYGALHLNPGSEFKSRGHLGSELERKSETNLRLEKTNGVFCAFGEDNRGAPIPKGIAPCFKWSNDAGMHASIESRQETKSDLQLNDDKMKVDEAFRLSGERALHYSDLISHIHRVTGSKAKSFSTAERIFTRVRDAGYITRNIIKQWEIAP